MWNVFFTNLSNLCLSAISGIRTSPFIYCVRAKLNVIQTNRNLKKIFLHFSNLNNYVKDLVIDFLFFEMDICLVATSQILYIQNLLKHMNY